MKIAAGFIAAGFAASLIFLWYVDQQAIEREAADPTDSLYRGLLGLTPPQPWYMTHRIELVLGVMVIAAVLGLLTALVMRGEER